MKYLFRLLIKLLFPPDQAQELHYLITALLRNHLFYLWSCFLRHLLHIPLTFWFYLKFHQCFSTSSFYSCWMFMPGADFNMGFCFFWMAKECHHKQTLYTHSYKMCSVFISSFRNVPVMMTFRCICCIFNEFLTNVFHANMQRKKNAPQHAREDILT